MIPKVIHYCWLSGDHFPKKIQHCINSWRKVLPDYELVLWDTKRFSMEQSAWVKEAFDAKKYAFAADYIRLFAIYHYGGIYLDCDVEVIKRFDDLLHLPYFIGKEAIGDRVEVAAFGAEKGTLWVKQCLDYYEGKHFKLPDGSLNINIIPEIVHEVISRHYEIKHINNKDEFICQPQVFNEFPNDWFCAHVYLRQEDISPSYIISDNTYCVHHFTNSWVKEFRPKSFIKRIILWLRIRIRYIYLTVLDH